MDDDLDDFLEFIDIEEEELHSNCVPKRYIRDAENPVEFFNEEEFRKRYRFTKDSVVQTLLPLVKERLEKADNCGLPIPPLIQLLIVLRFYGTCSFQVVSEDLRGISQATISRVIKRVSICLAELVGRYIRFPATIEEQRLNIWKFYEVAHFPTVSGCVDATHIKIANPGGEIGEVFRNRKGFFSLNIQVVAGPRREILDVVVRHPGSSHDSLIFDRSALRVRMERGDIPGVLLGDSAYPCRQYLLTPILHPGNHREVRYNTSHIATRNVVERLFGIWKRRFPCLNRGLQTSLDTSVAVICATAVLHNIGLHDVDYFADDMMVDEMSGLVDRKHYRKGLDFRRNFITQHFAD